MVTDRPIALGMLGWVAATSFITTRGTAQSAERPRARDVGVKVGIFVPGQYNAITDVAGVLVGQVTVVEGDTVNTGVTAIVPHGGSLFRERVPAALYVLNGFGKLVGVSQLREHGELETPILLTCTLCVWRAAEAMVDYLLERPGMERVMSMNPVVGETNDGGLNDIRRHPITREHVRVALETARTGPVDEGSVGAGRGTQALGWKGGIGTSSRRLPQSLGGYTVGVLVQSNFGGMLTINGAPVGRELGRYSFRAEVTSSGGDSEDGKGSIMMVVATDAPLIPSNLERLAKRAALGLSRTGAFGSASSGDFIIAFSTAEQVRRSRQDIGFATSGPPKEVEIRELPYHAMSPLFEAVTEATEEAVLNSLFRATAVRYRGQTADPLPIPETLEVLRKYNVLNWAPNLGSKRGQ